jgi:hypothetical protein
VTVQTATPDCWIETSVRCKGGRNMDGFYVLGHYPTVADGFRALEQHLARHPGAFALLTRHPDCPEGE